MGDEGSYLLNWQTYLVIVQLYVGLIPRQELKAVNRNRSGSTYYFGLS